jgi:hypothetical protein
MRAGHHLERIAADRLCHAAQRKPFRRTSFPAGRTASARTWPPANRRAMQSGRLLAPAFPGILTIEMKIEKLARF